MANPALQSRTVKRLLGAGAGPEVDVDAAATLNGVIAKTVLLFVIALAAGVLAYAVLFTAGAAFTPGPWMFGCWAAVTVGGLVCAVLIGLKPQRARALAPLYAALEGAWLMILTLYFETTAFPGIGAMAVTLTGGLFVLAMAAYWARWIVPTRRFVSGVLLATACLGLVYLGLIVCGLLGIADGVRAAFWGSGWFGIGFSVFAVGLATLNLIVDFGLIEAAIERRAPKWMEWFCAFALMVTLVWLYVELLRLLAKLSRRN